MRRRNLSSRIVLWAAVCTILLRAAAPMLATAAAALRGVPVGEVCEVYGMPVPRMAMDGHAMAAHAMAGHGHHPGGPSHHPPGADPDHGCDHCALTALAALSTASELPGHERLGVQYSPESPVEGSRWALHDACAAWAACLGHGPPA